METVLFEAVGLTVLVTAMWAGFDSWYLDEARYEGGSHPLLVLLACLLFWLLFFPWYVARRSAIARGDIARKPLREAQRPSIRPCPHCGQPVRSEAKLCRHCRQGITEPATV
jgi:hypothetical protein